MSTLDKLRAAHAEMATDQAVLIAAALQAGRRGDEAAVARYKEQLRTLAAQMRAAESLINDELGEQVYVL